MVFIDQLQNEIELKHPPQRIVSLVPSQTELLYHLKLEDAVVGITKFCIHPKEWFHSKEKIGGPKKVDLQKIASLQPDLIIGNKEENIKEEIEALSDIAPVWMSDIYNLADSLEMILQISKVCDRKIEGKHIVAQIQSNFNKFTPLQNAKRVLYMIWKTPYMAVGADTFIDSILTKHLGVVNAMGSHTRYPVLDMDNLPDVDYVFLSTEPYPFKEKHIAETQELFPKAKIMIVDGEYFTWYGSRLIDTPKYLETVKKEMG